MRRIPNAVLDDPTPELNPDEMVNCYGRKYEWMVKMDRTYGFTFEQYVYKCLNGTWEEVAA